MPPAVKTWDAHGTPATVEDLHRLSLQSNKNLQDQLNAVLAQMPTTLASTPVPTTPEVAPGGIALRLVNGELVVYVHDGGRLKSLVLGTPT